LIWGIKYCGEEKGRVAMKRLCLGCLILGVALCSATNSVFAQIGAFDSNMDIGDVGAAGSAEAVDLGGGDFGAANWEYEIQASGADIWGTADEFHFVYMEVEGDFTIFGRTDIFEAGDPEWTKSGLMVRNDLTPDSAYAYATLRTNLDFMA
jgi:hypothetical protein